MAIIDKPETGTSDEQPQNHNEFIHQLSQRDSVRLIEALEADAEPSDALKKAVERYKKLAVRR